MLGPVVDGALPRALQRAPDAGVDERLSVLGELFVGEGAVFDGHDEVEGVHVRR